MALGTRSLNGGRAPASDSQLQLAGATPPAAIESCLHDLIEQRCEEQPEAPAVCAWNGNFTYEQVSILAHSLGASLSARGVGPEVFVPIYFEKSRWTIIAMLGVLQAGGAFVLLDPSHPFHRLEGICRILKAQLVVASSQNAPQARRLSPNVVVVDEGSEPENRSVALKAAHHSKPNNAAYVMFTSGSTGVPKGALIEHRSISSSTVAHGPRMNMSRTSRVLQFAAYAWDVCLVESLTVLVHGGCVCIPSEAERRSDLVAAMNRLRVNLAVFTPSVARSLDPETLPTLETLICGGEAMSKEDRDQWVPHVNLYNAYGPAECSIAACVNTVSEVEDVPMKIGHPVGGSCWIVDENDVQSLCAVGQIGELLIEGPIVGRGYVGDEAKTAAAFIDRPDWLLKLWPNAQGKVYKTGDLASCHADGTIEFLGRKDSQLKVYGQRMEAAEIEYHLRSHLSAMDVAVDVVQPNDDLDSRLLAAFVVCQTRTARHSQTTSPESGLVVPEEEFQVLVQQVKSKMRKTLPSYMVPTVFLTLSSMPLSTAGKLDRRRLRQLGNSRTRRELLKLGLEKAVTKPPRDFKEEAIQRLWAEMLHLPTDFIGVDDSFWSLGGNSIRAMKLAGTARKRGLTLKTEDIWGAGTLEEMASRASMGHLPTDKVPAFSLCDDEDEQRAVVEALGKCQIRQDDIEDIYPSTRLQAGLLSSTAKSSGAYTISMEFELPPSIDIDRFRRAWQTTVEANPILRTRIVPGIATDLWQAVIRDVVPWDKRNPGDDIPKQWKDWQAGQRLIRLALSHPTASNTRHFTLVIHHALTDGWGLPLLLQQVEAAYRGERLTPRPFSPFVRYLTSQSQSEIDRYWAESLSDLNAATFPKLPSPGYVPKPTVTTAYTIPTAPASHTRHTTLPIQLTLAWGLLLSHYTDSWDVVFGVTVAGRGAPIVGIESMTGPTIATIPMRLLLEPQSTVIDTLKKIQEQSIRNMSAEQAGLQRISRLGAEPAAASQFQSLLVIQPDEEENRRPPLFSKCRDLTQQADLSSYGISVVAKPSSTSVEFEITYDPLMVTDVQMNRLTHQLEHIYWQIQQSPNARLEDIERISPSDMEELRKWNGRVPAQVEQCAHELIYQRTLTQPEAPAVCAWDGDFSYRELEVHAGNLARRLLVMGVGPETFVHLYFEKSRWTTVAMLGVLKAKGAFASLDPSHPMDRLQQICRETKGRIVICSESRAPFAGELGLSDVVILGPNHLESVNDEIIARSSPVTPRNAMYVVFTSGSTGKPKGAVITHGAWCTAAQANYPKMHLGQGTRVLQFAAYAFDMSVFDNLVTLVAGGCVCVPSGEDRMSNLAGAIAALKANWAIITPSVSRILSPQTCPTLKHLALCGEPMSRADVERWSPYLHLMNSYGPAECAVQVSLQPVVDITRLKNIGTVNGAVGWVVDPRNPGRLCAVGTVGELLLEGPIMAREYINNPQRTAEAFIEAPPWLRAFRDVPSPLYKTGDLVQYTADGELAIVGRKDTQVKLRGQRVEMEEVEYHLRRCFPGAQGVVADVLPPQDDRAALLAGFVLRTPSNKQSNLIVESDASFRKAAAIALSQMRQAVPPYMVPAALIPLSRLPLSATGKLNRRDLRSQAALLSREQLDNFRMAEEAAIRQPETHSQAELRRLFGDVLSIPEGEIGIEDDFFRRGGDSLSAMKLVALAQKSGYSLTVRDIFAGPRIIDLAVTTSMVNDMLTGDIPPFSLVPGLGVQEQIISAQLVHSDVTRDQIEDIYPATPMQEGLMALSLKTPGKYVATFVYDLQEGIDLERFRTAVDSTVSANPILRTRLTQTSQGSFQVVIQEPAQWRIHASQQDCDKVRSKLPAMGPNERLLILDLVVSRPRLVITIHHALYDGWSVPLLWSQIEAAYRGQLLQYRMFTPFIRFLQQDKDSNSFWRSQFAGLDAGVFPPLPSATYEPKPNQAIRRQVPMPSCIQTDVTISTSIQLAWAIIMSYYTDSNDVVFGLMLSGRNAPVPGVDQFTGPTLATVPLRTRLDLDRSIRQELLGIQNRLTAMMGHEQTGLRNIQFIDDEAAKACEFQSHLGIQPPEMSVSGTLATEVDGNAQGYSDFASYGIVMICHLPSEKQGHLDTIAQYDPNMLDPPQAHRIVAQFEHVLHQILSHPNMPIRSISVVSGEDWQQLERWNAALPPSSEQCLHDLVLEHSISRPNAPALAAWDGDLTFQGLASFSNQFAQALRAKGIQKGSIVPVCLQRSKWCVISMMAVLRSGATLVCIDPMLPPKRLENILDQVQPQIVIASSETRDKFQGCHATILTVPLPQEESLPDPRPVSELIIEPSTPAFIVFTSGSTGEPKGIVMEHRNLVTSIHAHSGPLRVTRDSRLLHFASYAFDISIYEVFTTLVSGGCLCIPSEADRMNAIEKFIVDKQVTVALLTPSLIAMLDPAEVPSMKTITVGGEALTRHIASRWAPRVTLVNGYGPAETTICAAGVVEHHWKPGTIGAMLGAVAWVTVPSDPQRLVPLGAIGELIIEGPVVTRGYLNRPDLTQAGYIDPPEWLVRWRNGKPGRVYRSGDLVELTNEGAIRFIGRKDTQVKLRGQRIELAEVEYHVRRCTGAQDAVVDIATVDGSSVLFACIVQGLQDGKGGTGLFLPPTPSFRNDVQIAEATLQGSLPSYMIPTILLPIAEAPRTAGGKVDRRRLRDAVAGLPSADRQAYTAGSRREHRQPSNVREATIHAVWALVLNKELEAIGVDDSFFHLGGDSITAMRMISQLGRVGIITSVGDIFKQRTIANLASTVTGNKNDTSCSLAEAALGMSFRPSPIQQLFLDRHPAYFDRFRQGSLFELQRPVESEEVEKAVRWLIETHCMLRARLSCDTGGEWRQRITSDIDVSYQYKRHHRISHANAGAIFRAHQEVLGVEHGPLIVVDLMHMDGGAQWLSIIAHGLVVDRVSWQIIVGHLEQVLDSKPVSPTPGMLYSDWCRLLEEHIGSTACLGSHRTPVAMMDYWGLTDTTNVYADVDVYEISLGREKTDLLLGSANDPIQTRPSELIQTALLLAFSKTFPGRSMPAIFIEDHSRDGWGGNIDVAGTVGWLSSIYPCHVQVDASHDLVDMVRRLKDARRDAEDGGRFFMAAQRGQRIEMEILFSYGGASQKTGKPGSLFKPAPVCTRQLLGNGSHVVPFAPIVILAEVTDGQLLVQFTYSRSMKKAGAIIKWALQTYEALSTLAQQLPTLPRSLTRSDFPLLHLTDEHFEQFRTETINPFIRSGYAVVDAYSCSPIQHGILLTQAKNPQEYINRAVWTVRDRQGQPVDTDRLVHAWHKVVEKHSILRTVFMNSSRGDGSMDQVVIDDVRPDIVKLASTESDDPLEALPKYEDCIFPRLCPPHRLTVGRSATGAAACSWEVSHALVDGITTSVVLRDLLQAYDGLLPSETDRVYRAYISHLQRQLPEPCQAYWDKYTENLQPCFFPKLVTDTGHVWDSGVGHLNRTLAGVPGLRAFCQLHELTLATVFQVAWGLVLRAYARSDDVCYGYMTSGRDTPIQGIEEAAGPFINLLVRRMHFGEGLSTIAMLHKSQEEFARCLTYQYWPLASITHRHQGILFNSVMSVQSIMPSLLVPDSSLVFHEEEGHNATEYDLALHIETGRADVDVLLDYKQSLLADSEAEFVADAFEQAVQGIVNYFEQPAKSVPVLGGNSLKAVWEWNQAFPRSVERCVGDMILDNYRSKPYSPAVCAWDGSFTYAELEIHSARLSRRLSHDYGVGPEVFVPIYAIKSRWVTVAITAVIRAGGAFILLDPSHPLSRLRTICTSCQATVILALPQHQEMACKLVSRVATFGEEGLEAECSGESHGATEIATGLTPDNALYGIFTSGSTGQPKGVIIQHRAFATSAVTQVGTLQIRPQSRVLQFASFAFDVAVGEILTTLVQGGCLCMPSEEQRQQALSQAAYELKVNWAFLTPSVARVLRPADFPTLRTLVLAGEAVGSKEVQMWSPMLNLILGYGPAECAVWCSGTVEKCHPGTDQRSLGRWFGCRIWIVDPEDPNLLVPLGATGELVIDGPIIGRGYLNDPSTTRAAFLEGPRPWLDGKSRLLYRTGDLARYKADGTLQFVARKDLQVKLRGQRFELAEVEHHLRQVFDQAHDTLAEVATTSNGSKRLVAFIHLPDPFTPEGNHNNSLIASATHSFRSIAQASETQLHMRMPGYMVPTLYLPLQRVPLTNNGKLDRRRLREAVGAFSLEDLEAYSAPATARTKPSTPVEQCLQQIWSDVLDRPANTIGVEDNFFRLGGDSLRAMSLIRGAREAGYTISVADVFNSPRLRDLSQTAISTTGEEGVSLAPFALVPDSTDLIDTAAEGCNVPPSQIEDIYPCTPLQEGLMALSTKSADRYKVTFRYQLYVQVDLDQFQSAWIAIAAANPILRTRMIQSDYHPGTFQVVLADLPRFHLFDNQKAFDEHIRACEMTLGNELVDLSLIQSCDSAGVQFCLTVHHAVYDGWTIPSLCAQVEEYYQRPQSIPSARPFNRFLEYVQRQSDAAAEYWRNEFSGLSAPAWPALPSARHAPVANSSLRHTITRLNFSDDSEYTTTTLIHLAWALVMSSQTESDDVVYGVTLNGRSAPLVGIEDMTGPTITTFPLRVRLGLDCDTVEDALSAIQRQAVDRMPFQQFGLQNIRNTSAEASQACQFQSHLGVQPASAAQKASNIFAELSGDHDDYGSFAEYAFVIVCHLDDADTSSLQLVVNYDPQVVSSPAAKRLLGQFAHLLQQLPENLRTPLSQLGMLSPEDKRQLSIWNREIPSSFDVCLHDLVLAHAIAAPYSPAISAWDGNLTYAQLTSLSGQLASQLRLIGVHPSTLVPLCFEKSKWAAITMLAVMRAGGACVPLDPGHPPHHIENIIRRSNAKVVLTSHKTRKLIPADCGASVKTIPLQGLPAQATSKSWPEPSCHDVAFVIFTSGSTGEPKGILMEHVNLCTSIRDHSPPMLISPSTRALHFASYAFDASIYELFTVLASGGCVCIPSDSDRLGNLAAFIREAHVNYAIFTPSILDRLLRPELVPGLKTVTFGGEAVTQTIVDTWSPHLTLINGYGPAEATICAAGPIDASSWTSGTIGPVTGGLGWITMPSDVSRLAPVGAVGELVIEGPVVTRGYLNDTERTAAAYISPPRWLAEFRGEEKAGRLYRTGDLVQYTDDGGIRFVGRKDTQIKLRGQRVELSHVEHHVQLCFTEAAEIVAEIVLRDGNPTLFAFIAQKKPDDHECDDGDLFLRTSTSFRVQVQSATARLKTLLPVYMVPAVFLRLARVPRTSSDKLDRRQLRDRAARLSNDQIRALSTSSEEVSGTSHPPQTARECLFQQLWGTVLNISMDKIGTQDDFFELGGDSIQAMKLTSLLRREGIGLNVTDIFAWPILADQARGASEHTHQADVEPYNPGSLLGIEDILPTTEFQRQFLEYQQVYYLQLRLPMKIDSARLEKACHAMVDRHPMLRSVFLPYQNGYLQMVLRRLEFELIQLSCDEDLDAYVERLCVENASRGFPCGTPYFQVLLVSRSPSDSVLVMRASHAQFDGESLPLMLQDLILVYEGAQLEKSTPPSFALFLRHRQLHANPRTYKFWEQYLQNAVMTTLGLSGSDSDLPLNVRRSIPLPTPPRGITISSLVKAAWAVVLAQVTGQQDLVFGHVLNGRDTPMAEAHAISGPCVTVSPIRITIPPSNQVLDLLHHTQAQYTRALPYAGIDFGTIRQHSTSWPENTSFSSLQTHQNGSYHHPSFKIQGHDCAFETRPIGGAPQFHVATMTLQDKLIVNLNISSRLGSLADIENLSDRLCSAIADLECGSFPSLSS